MAEPNKESILTNNSSSAGKARQKNLTAQKIVFYVTLYAVLVLFAVVEIFPFVWMIFTSFKSAREVVQNTGFYLFPKDFSVEAYYGKTLYSLFDLVPFWRGLLNTLITESSFFFVGIFADILAAYGFAQVRFRFRNGFLLFILCATMIPFVVTLMPQYAMFSFLGLTGTMWPLLIPHFFGTVGVIFYLERYMHSLPRDIFEAGAIDGLSHIGRVFFLAIPMAVPALVVQCVFTFLGIWNDVLAPDIYLTRLEDKTLQVMMQYLSVSAGSTRISLLPVLMAGATLSSLPILILYLSCQNLFVNSMATAGIKG